VRLESESWFGFLVAMGLRFSPHGTFTSLHAVSNPKEIWE